MPGVLVMPQYFTGGRAARPRGRDTNGGALGSRGGPGSVVSLHDSGSSGAGVSPRSVRSFASAAHSSRGRASEPIAFGGARRGRAARTPDRRAGASVVGSVETSPAPVFGSVMSSASVDVAALSPTAFGFASPPTTDHSAAMDVTRESPRSSGTHEACADDRGMEHALTATASRVAHPHASRLVSGRPPVANGNGTGRRVATNGGGGGASGAGAPARASNPKAASSAAKRSFRRSRADKERSSHNLDAALMLMDDAPGGL